tara:strand:- start:142 stop:405 length:264 start_codon:yes stop_codon:yes gene_type:complete
LPKEAALAQLVEHLICNQAVSGSIPEGGSKNKLLFKKHFQRRESSSLEVLFAFRGWYARNRRDLPYKILPGKTACSSPQSWPPPAAQ